MEVDRVDGLTPDQLRPLVCSRNVLNRDHGSANWSQCWSSDEGLIDMVEISGDIKVLAAVYGPKVGAKKNENPEKGDLGDEIWAKCFSLLLYGGWRIREIGPYLARRAGGSTRMLPCLSF